MFDLSQISYDLSHPISWYLGVNFSRNKQCPLHTVRSLIQLNMRWPWSGACYKKDQISLGKSCTRFSNKFQDFYIFIGIEDFFHWFHRGLFSFGAAELGNLDFFRDKGMSWESSKPVWNPSEHQLLFWSMVLALVSAFPWQDYGILCFMRPLRSTLIYLQTFWIAAVTMYHMSHWPRHTPEAGLNLNGSQRKLTRFARCSFQEFSTAWVKVFIQKICKIVTPL